jgi:hypothetical protein
MEKSQPGEGLDMLKMVRKPPIGNVRSDRLKVTLAGNHTMKQKASMLMQVKFWLQHEQGIDSAGPTDVYFSLLDPNGYPLTAFRDGQAIADYILVIESPYHCAADEYDMRQLPPVPRAF